MSEINDTTSTEVTAVNTVSVSALTDVGRVRGHNEDNFILCPNLSLKEWYLVDKPQVLSPAGCLLVVADGMGGANAGEVASELAVETIKKFFTELAIPENLTDAQAGEYLRESILVAHRAIVAHATENPACEGMGTTVIVAWVLPGRAVLAWCGDSRGYLFRPEEGIRIITKDHSLVWELVEAGELTPQEADIHPDSNIITQSLGDPDYSPKPDVVVQRLHSSDKLLLCSDGLNNMVSLERIEQIIRQSIALPEINQQLIQAANENGGKDNITSVLLEVHAQPVVPGQATPIHNSKAGRSTKIPPYLLGLAGVLVLALLWWVASQRTPISQTAVASLNDSNRVHQKDSMISADAPNRVVSQTTNIDYDTSGLTTKAEHNTSGVSPGNGAQSTTQGVSERELNRRMVRLNKIVDQWVELDDKLAEVRASYSDTSSNTAQMVLLDQQQEALKYRLDTGELTMLVKKWNNPQKRDSIRQQFTGTDLKKFDARLDSLEKELKGVKRILK